MADLKSLVEEAVEEQETVSEYKLNKKCPKCKADNWEELPGEPPQDVCLECGHVEK